MKYLPHLLFSIYVGAIGISIYVLFVMESPTNLIVGEWKESEWEYEILVQDNKAKMLTQDSTRSLIDQKYLIHKAESWIFYPDFRLIIKRKDNTDLQAKWKLKGRGHILKITFENGDVEIYDIKELNEKELIINFDIGMEVRGIAQLVFKLQGKP